MNLRKIIREEMDDMGWMKGDEPFQVTTTNGKKYWLSHDTIKAGDFVVYQTASGLWREYGKINPEKVDDANTFTDYYKVIDPLMMEEEMDDFDWDWAINSQPLELQDPKEWIGKSFGYGQSIIDCMYDYEIERGDDKETFEIVGVEDDGLLIARVHPSFGRVGFATKVYIRAFIERMNKGVWIWA